jgi:hypothetical protein
MQIMKLTVLLFFPLLYFLITMKLDVIPVSTTDLVFDLMNNGKTFQ